MNELVIRALRVVLAVLLVVMLTAQVLVLPWLSGVFAQDYPELASLRVPVLLASILVVVCGEVVAVCTWVLLDMVQQESIFSGQAFSWVDRVVGAILCASALVLAVFVYLSFGVDVQHLVLTIATLGAVAGGLTVALLLVVMRGLLRKASSLQADMAQVI